MINAAVSMLRHTIEHHYQLMPLEYSIWPKRFRAVNVQIRQLYKYESDTNEMEIRNVGRC